jgi:RecQ family ATP-dependent DNA helicase
VNQAGDLTGLLRERFGHLSFRPHQEDVCRAAAAGGDLLLVMPTGAGKSLCYQLPALARGGSSLVVSPLIALMEDQVAKLQASGLRVDRIHSGRSPAEMAQAAQRWMDGELELLYVAPERLGVASFRRLLETRRPRLVAVDEAHCISHWGHDFRPDYRTVGPQLEGLRDGPVVAVTATATPRVQDDIVAQLGIPHAARFIRGFRRDNLAIEVVETTPSARSGVVARILADPARRPAIVYAPTRRETESLAGELGATLPAAAYHAGLPTAERERVQRAFADDELEAVVATVAFGMGVDKADIRTVVHTALPGTVEAYYQEIGRAGRDGLPSRVVLLWSWADRRTQEFFHTKSYPEPATLQGIWRLLEAGPKAREEVEGALGLDRESSSTILNQLWLHGGVRVDGDGLIHQGVESWRATYTEQRNFRLDQIEEACQFAAGRSCRMVNLVRHFGDREDRGEPCGQCDACAPDRCVVTSRRRPSVHERHGMERLIEELKGVDSRTTGQLFESATRKLGFDRRDHERLVDALSGAGVLDVWQDSFTKDGREIRFHRARLSRSACIAGGVDLDEILMTSTPPATATKKSRKKRTSKHSAPESASSMTAATVALDIREESIMEDLRTWRLGEARKQGVPAYRILSDKVLTNVVRANPSDLEDMLEVHGMGPKLVRKWGMAVLEILARNDGE